jgi:hypothetical protein
LNASEKPRPGQLWWAYNPGNKLAGWRVVTLEARRPNLLGASWRAFDLETRRECWLSEERWDPTRSAARLLGPRSSDPAFYTFAPPPGQPR